eukprot:1140537-Pelagomonas_calceolata.AAC.3
MSSTISAFLETRRTRREKASRQQVHYIILGKGDALVQELSNPPLSDWTLRKRVARLDRSLPILP